MLKEKVVQLYEGFFRGEQVAVGNTNFWEEFFLIKPKMAALEAEIGSLQVPVLVDTGTKYSKMENGTRASSLEYMQGILSCD